MKRMSETDSGSSDGRHAPPVIEAAAKDSNQHDEESQDGDANSGSRHVNPVREAAAEDGNNDEAKARSKSSLLEDSEVRNILRGHSVSVYELGKGNQENQEKLRALVKTLQLKEGNCCAPEEDKKQLLANRAKMDGIEIENSFYWSMAKILLMSKNPAEYDNADEEIVNSVGFHLKTVIESNLLSKIHLINDLKNEITVDYAFAALLLYVIDFDSMLRNCVIVVFDTGHGYVKLYEGEACCEQNSFMSLLNLKKKKSENLQGCTKMETEFLAIPMLQDQDRKFHPLKGKLNLNRLHYEILKKKLPCVVTSTSGSWATKITTITPRKRRPWIWRWVGVGQDNCQFEQFVDRASGEAEPVGSDAMAADLAAEAPKVRGAEEGDSHVNTDRRRKSPRLAAVKHS